MCADTTASGDEYLSWICFGDSLRFVGSIRDFNPVKLFVGLLASDSKFLSAAERPLTESYGPIDHRTDAIPFTFTKYYEKEMGPSIHRVFFSFERLIEADRLPEIKRKTN